MAMLLLPTLLFNRAESPTAMLFLPVVLALSALAPLTTLELPVVLDEHRSFFLHVEIHASI